MKFTRPFKCTFIPWLHWQEFRQRTSDNADFWVRYLRLGRFMILWDAPKHGTPNRVAHIKGTTPTELRIPKEKP